MNGTSDGGEHGHQEMERSATGLARACVCPVHGVVVPEVVGKRWRCPVCKLFVPKQETIAIETAPKASERTIEESLWRLEVHHILGAIARRLSAGPEEMQSLSDFGVVIDWIQYADSGHMIFPAADLEKALQRIKERSARLVGSGRLYQDLEGLQADRARLVVETERLRRTKAELEQTTVRSKSEAGRLQAGIRAVESKTGMSYGEILDNLRNFRLTAVEATRLAAAMEEWRRECWSAQNHLNQLNGEIGRKQEEIQRLVGLQRETLSGLVCKLSVRDAMSLLELALRREFDQAMIKLVSK